MANPAELNAATNVLYGARDPIDLIFKASPAFYLMFRNDKTKQFDMRTFQNSIIQPTDYVSGGTETRWPLEVALANGGSLENGTVLNTAQKTLFTYCYESLRAAQSAVTVNFTEQQQNTGEAQIFDLAVKKSNSMRKKIQDILATSMLQFNSVSGVLTGLPDLFNTTTSTTYLGIKEADEATIWKSNATATAQTMSFGTMQDVRRTAKVGDTTDAFPDLYLTSQTLYDSFEQGLNTQERYMKDTDMANAGFENVYFKGCPLVPDNKLDTDTNGIMSLIADPSGTGYGATSVIAINRKFLMFKTHPKFTFKVNPWAYDIKSPQILVSSIFWSGMLVCTYRAAQAWWYAVTAA